MKPITTHSLLQFAYAASAKEDSWPLSHFVSLWDLWLTCSVLPFAQTWYVVGKSKSPPTTACPTFSGLKSQCCSTKWQTRYHNSGEQIAAARHLRCLHEKVGYVGKGSDISHHISHHKIFARSDTRHQKSVQNSTSQSSQVLKMCFSQWCNFYAVS